MRASRSESGVTPDRGVEVPSRVLFDVSSIDLSSVVATREQIARINPHRGSMALLDAVVWISDDGTRGVGLRQVRGDEFWCAGHFPGKPLYPGVLQIESAAQLACYLYNIRRPTVKTCVFLRIEHASFRTMVQPGDDLVLLCQDVKFGHRRFICDVQGVLGMSSPRVAFEARITGMNLGD